MQRITILASVLTVLGLFGAFSSTAGRAADESDKDIMETAITAGQLKTLVEAVKAAGLTETLKGPGPFTVFAPTDEAFARVGKEKLEGLLMDKEALSRILTYHVVSGKVMRADAAKLDSAKTVQGKPLMISSTDGRVKINGATVIKADIVCKNGVIHVIDAVLLPPKN
jgi:uncharacterized surface protein with fasciclin (FAS1) repeats